MSALILVTNPGAGRGGLLGRARRALADAGLTVGAELPIARVAELPEVIGRSAADEPLVVAAGGDGTVGAVVNHLVGRGAVLGVLPLGTSNDFARSMRIPMRIERAARLLGEGTVTTVDLGRMVAPDRPPAYFVHAATVGVNVAFARLATRASFRRRLGRLTYVVAARIALRHRRSFDCRLTYGGRTDEVRLTQLSVIAAPVFGGVLGLRVSGADPDDRLLDVLTIEPVRVWRAALVAAALLLRARWTPRGMRAFHASRLSVHTEAPLAVALDGEVAGRLPADFDLAGDALRVMTRPDFGRPAG